MSKMQLVLLEQDSYFIGMCSAYIRTSEYAETFSVSVFTTKEQGYSFIERFRESFILLVHESFLPLPESFFPPQRGCLIVLSDKAVLAETGDYPVLCKYQPLNQLISHAVSLFNEYASTRMLKGSRSSRLLSVYSAVGGSGKTLTAVHLARELVYQGRRVFYINLEQLPSRSWLETGGEEGENHFSRMLYYGKTDSRLQTAKVELFKRRHPTMGFDYFPGISDTTEMDEMTGNDARTLIQSLRATGTYDDIVVDLDSFPHQRVTAALELSDQILWLVADERVQLEKNGQMFRLLTGPGGCLENEEPAHKLHWIMNKFSGAKYNAATQLPAPVSGYLPYMPDWKAYSSVEALQARSAFSESLASLAWLFPEAEDRAHVVG